MYPELHSQSTFVAEDAAIMQSPAAPDNDRVPTSGTLCRLPRVTDMTASSGSVQHGLAGTGIMLAA